MKKSSAIFCIFLILPLFWAESAATTLGQRVQSSLEARKKADQYSFDTGGVGIFISYGRKNGVSAQAVGNAFVKELEQRGVKSKYFFYNTDSDGMAMEFYIGYSAMGPWNTRYAASQISKVVARAKAAQNVHRQ